MGFSSLSFKIQAAFDPISNALGILRTTTKKKVF